jgi:pimeloyl-ACP methyl ester carboxylesterase
MRKVPAAPEPPVQLPPARTVQVPGRGEFFLRDSQVLEGDSDAPVVMLLHGWIASADLNWVGCYQALIDAGYRVLAIDHRGHGRGLRPLTPFRLSECAADAAAVLRTVGLAPATIVGYSMGGAIAQLIVKEQADVVSGVVLSGTCQHWQEPQVRRTWRWMWVLRLILRINPEGFWRFGFRRTGLSRRRGGVESRTAWLLSELLRHDARAIAEAGRELGRFDSRPWLQPLPVPSAVLITTKDTAVPPWKQRELADALQAEVFESAIEHLEVTTAADRYVGPLLAAVASVGRARAAAV